MIVCLLLSSQYRGSMIDVLSCGYISQVKLPKSHYKFPKFQKPKVAKGAEVNSINNNNIVRGPFIVTQQ